jgi:hypothetical protein
VRDNSIFHQEGSSAEKCSDAEQSLKVELTGFSVKLNVKRERKRSQNHLCVCHFNDED